MDPLLGGKNSTGLTGNHPNYSELENPPHFVPASKLTGLSYQKMPASLSTFHHELPPIALCLLVSWVEMALPLLLTLFGSSPTVFSSHTASAPEPPASQHYFSLTPLQPPVPVPAHPTDLSLTTAARVAIAEDEDYCYEGEGWTHSPMQVPPLPTALALSSRVQTTALRAPLRFNAWPLHYASKHDTLRRRPPR